MSRWVTKRWLLLALIFGCGGLATEALRGVTAPPARGLGGVRPADAHDPLPDPTYSISGVVRGAPADRRGAGKLLPGAGVFVVNLPKGVRFPAPGRPVELIMDNCRISPSYACVVVGQQLVLSPKDGEIHNPWVESRHRPHYSSVIPPQGAGLVERFDRPEPWVSCTCSVHASERAIVTVVPNPVFTLAGPGGNYRLPHRLPAGTYVLRACFPGWISVEKKVVLDGVRGEVKVDFQLGYAPD
jgi:hypothetical protein